MNNKITQTIIGSFFWLSQCGHADTLILEDGEKIEGKLIRETEDSYVIEISITEKIKDEKIIPKSKVRSLEKEAPDSILYSKIKSLTPTPERLSVANYEERIETVESFLNEFPESGKVPRVQRMLDTLQAELEVVRAGGIKFNGKMVTADEYDANTYEYDAMMAEKEIQVAIERREIIGALKLFAVYETKFGRADGRENLVGRIRQVLSVLSTAVESSIASYDDRVAKRDAGLEQMSGDDKLQTERAIARQHETLEKRFVEEKAIKAGWITPDENHKGSLEECRRQIQNELKRLDSNKKDESIGSVAEAYRNTWKVLETRAIFEGEDGKKKLAVFEELESMGMPQAYVDKLSKRAEIFEEKFRIEKEIEKQKELEMKKQRELEAELALQNELNLEAENRKKRNERKKIKKIPKDD